MKDPRDRVQREAFKAWCENGRQGTIQAITGVGKTFIALHAINELEVGDRILFLAETRQREQDLKEQIVKYREVFGIDLSGKDIEFMCYQSAYRKVGMEHTLVIADEIHDSLSPAYSKYYRNNSYDRIMGLSATIDDDEVTIDGEETTKMDLLNTIAPICFSYTLDEGQEDGTSRPLDIYVLHHKLDSTRKIIPGGSKKKPFMTTEAKTYEYWDKRFKRSMFYRNPSQKEVEFRISSNRRAELLYSLPSKVEAINQILAELNGKTIIFGNDLNALEQITPNVVRSAKKGESAKQRESENSSIRQKFDNGDIDVIASFKMLKQGANLKGIDNVILMSYYSKERDLLQRVGRLRKDGNRIGTVIIPVTVGTQEEKWFTKMTEGVNIRMTPCLNVTDLVSRLK
jgi:superfamily II DNA or RNA helicase